MKLATTTGDFLSYTKNIQEVLKLLNQCGFKYVDFDFGKSKVPEIYSDNWESYIDRAKNVANELGMEFVQSHAPMGAPFADDNAQFVEDNIRCIRCCKELGIKNIVVHAGYKTGLTKQETFEKTKNSIPNFFPMQKNMELIF